MIGMDTKNVVQDSEVLSTNSDSYYSYSCEVSVPKSADETASRGRPLEHS